MHSNNNIIILIIIVVICCLLILILPIVLYTIINAIINYSIVVMNDVSRSNGLYIHGSNSSWSSLFLLYH